MLLPIKNTLLMVILSVGLTIAQNQTSENDCSWSQSTPNCKEYQKHFDPLPSVTKQKGRGEFHRVDPLQRMQDGLNCLAYDVLVSPKEAAGDKTDPMKVNISVQVLELEELDPHKQELELEKSLSLTWIDWRLKWPAKCNESHNYFIDISKTYQLLWQPKLRYVGMRSQESQETVPLQSWYPATGQVTIEQTFTERHACKANLRWYPFDAINCEMIHVLDSKMDKAVLQKSNQDENFRNFLAGWTTLSEESHLNETTKGVINHSTLVYQFRFKREVSSEVMQTFLPSLMLSIASSSSLYISFDQLPARMGLCATTFLALIALFKGSRYYTYGHFTYASMPDFSCILQQ